MLHITLVHLSSDNCMWCGSGEIAEAQDVFMARQKEAEAAVMAALRGQHCIAFSSASDSVYVVSRRSK